jgi:hypothetical protein
MVGEVLLHDTERGIFGLAPGREELKSDLSVDGCRAGPI